MKRPPDIIRSVCLAGILLLLPAWANAQSALTAHDELSYDIVSFLNKDKNPALNVSLPKLNSANKYPLNKEILSIVNKLNLEGNTDIAREVLSKIDLTRPIKISSIEKKIQPPPADKYALRDHLEDFVHVLKITPESKDLADKGTASQWQDPETRYYHFLKGENLFLANDINGAKSIFYSLLTAPVPVSNWSGDLVRYYSECLAKKNEPMSLPFDTIFQHMLELSEEGSVHTVFNFIPALAEAEDIEKAYLLMGMVDENNSEAIYRRFYKILQGILSIEFIANIQGALADKTMLHLADLRRAEIYAANDNFEEAGRLIELAMSATSNSYVKEEARAMQELLNVSRNFDRTKIGVLLPFSYTKFQSIVEEVMEGLMIAQQESGRKFTLVFEDTELDPKIAEAKARKLILEDKVSAVIGPLAKNTSMAVGKVADQLNVPFFSLSLTSDVGTSFEYLFRVQNNPKAVLEALASYSTDYLNARSYTIIATSDNSTQQKVLYLSSKLNEKGQALNSVFTVPEDQSDFRDIFRDISGKTLYLDSQDRQNKVKKDKDLDDSYSNLDAVFLFLRPRQLLNIENYFKAYNLQNVWILMDHWQHEYQLLNSIFDKIRFSGAFSILEVNGAASLYSEKHWALLGFQEKYSSPSFYSFYAYNALTLASRILGDESVARSERIAKLKNPEYINTALPGFTYNGGGEINLDETMYRLDNWKNTVSIFHAP